MKYSLRSLMIVAILAATCGPMGGCGTGSVPEMSLAELQQLVHGKAEGEGATIWKGTFYCGTDGEFHYLRNRTKTKSDRLIRIKTSSLKITPLEKYPLDESKWVNVSQLILESDK